MTLHQLEAMRAGGIHDQRAAASCCYSTDREWLVPHFEEDALRPRALILGTAYVDGWLVTRDALGRVSRAGIVTYVKRDLTSDHGAFGICGGTPTARRGDLLRVNTGAARRVLPPPTTRAGGQHWGVTELRQLRARREHP